MLINKLVSKSWEKAKIKPEMKIVYSLIGKKKVWNAFKMEVNKETIYSIKSAERQINILTNVTLS